MEIIRHEKNKSVVTLFSNDYSINKAMKNEFNTSFFNLKVNKIEVFENELNSYVVEDDVIFLVIDISIKNLTNDVLNMYKEDLLISYDNEEPYCSEDFFNVTGQLQDEYAIKRNETITGKLVFLVSNEAKIVTLGFTEYYDDDVEGKTYRVKYIIK